MTRRTIVLKLFVTFQVTALATMLSAQYAAGDDPAGFKFFESNVRPILSNRCYECHGPDTDEPEAGLRLDSLAGMRTGGRMGPAIQLKRPDKSLLILQINHDPTVAGMPPKKKLPRAEVAALTKWVKSPESIVQSQTTQLTTNREFLSGSRLWTLDSRLNCWTPKFPFVGRQ